MHQKTESIARSVKQYRRTIQDVLYNLATPFVFTDLPEETYLKIGQYVDKGHYSFAATVLRETLNNSNLIQLRTKTDNFFGNNSFLSEELLILLHFFAEKKQAFSYGYNWLAHHSLRLLAKGVRDDSQLDIAALQFTPVVDRTDEKYYLRAPLRFSKLVRDVTNELNDEIEYVTVYYRTQIPSTELIYKLQHKLEFLSVLEAITLSSIRLIAHPNEVLSTELALIQTVKQKIAAFLNEPTVVITGERQKRE